MFSQRYINNSTTPSKNNWNVSFLLRKIRQISVMPPNFGKQTKSPKCALFCFIEGISIILKIQQLKFLQIEGRFVRTPHKQLKWNLRISWFWMTKCFKSQSWDLICFEGTWYEIWSTQKFTNSLEISHRCLIGFHFASVLQNDQVHFRWFAFEKWILLMQKIDIFQNFRNFWISNFYFRWLYIIEKTSNFDGWPGVD